MIPKTITNPFLRKSAVKIMINLLNERRETYERKIMKLVDISTSSANHTINSLIIMRLLDTRVSGRKKMLKLTRKGRIIAENLRNIKEKCVVC